MEKQNMDKLSALKKVFLVLLILDAVGLVMTGIALFPTLQRLAGYGTFMLVVAVVLSAAAVAVALFEILAKVFLMRASGGKSHTALAVLLIVFNFGGFMVNLLSSGGEGATPVSQGIGYLRMLAAVAEIVAVALYLRAVKRLTKAE